MGAELTPEERHYAQANAPFTFCVDPDWAPYEIINAQGQHEGISADLLRLAAKRAGVTLKLVVTKSWDESLEASKSGKCKILSFLNQTPKRDEWLVFTDPIFVDRNVIVTREEHPYIEDLAGIRRKTLVLPSGTSIEERVRRDFPELTILTTGSEAESFSMVSGKKADMTMRSLIVAVYTIKKDGWFNLKVSGQVPGYENNLRIGVRKEDGMLRDILNKGIAEILPPERTEIANRHVSIKVQTGIDYDLLIKIVAVFAIILLTSLFWAVRLKKLNERLRRLSRTDSLTGLSNRGDLNERMDAEIERSQRYGRPFSVIMLDLDHFKMVNDELGHQAGDHVLKEFSKLVKTHLRTHDMLGRWGGEEFLVLCSETNAEQAAVLGGRICDAVRNCEFISGRRQTVSAGIAAYQPGDGQDSLQNRADQALYAAKNEGRDRAVLL
ncbi:MAG: diguanylate cyclase [Alphaproteobacteria bacterium]|nr:diguanylate cyclase [Alphaproteobacteria bacterium]